MNYSKLFLAASAAVILPLSAVQAETVGINTGVNADVSAQVDKKDGYTDYKETRSSTLVQPDGNVKVQSSEQAAVTTTTSETTSVDNANTMADTAPAAGASASSNLNAMNNENTRTQTRTEVSYSTTETGIIDAINRQSLASLINKDVYDEKGNKIGEIENFVAANAAAEPRVVISHGGFLGLGEKKAVLPLDTLTTSENAVILQGETKASLKNQTEYQAANFIELDQRSRTIGEIKIR